MLNLLFAKHKMETEQIVLYVRVCIYIYIYAHTHAHTTLQKFGITYKCLSFLKNKSTSVCMFFLSLGSFENTLVPHFSNDDNVKLMSNTGLDIVHVFLRRKKEVLVLF